jgi:pyruvate formate lyase activating enzyme
MAAVFFTAGCNFRCGFCHNAALLGRARAGYSWDQLAELCERFRRKWVRHVVITGGEPTLSAALPDTIAFFRERGFEVKLDTNGSNPDVLRSVLPSLAYVAMDIKCALGRYPSFVSYNDPSRIEQSIALIRRSGVPHEFRTTLIEGVHTDDDVAAIGHAIRGADVHVLQAFIPRDDLPDPQLRNAPRTTPERLYQAADILRTYVRDVKVRGD